MNVFEHKIIKQFISQDSTVLWESVNNAGITVVSKIDIGLHLFHFKDGQHIGIKHDNEGKINYVTQGTLGGVRKYYKEKHIRRIIKILSSKVINSKPRVRFGVL